MNTGTRSEYYILFAISFIAAIWFFVGYPSQDPRSAIEISFEEEEISLKAIENISELGFSISNYSISEVSFVGNDKLLDSLQSKQGRGRAIESLKKNNLPNLKPFFWQVVFQKKRNVVTESSQPSSFGPNTDKELRMYLDERGTFIALRNASEYVPQTRVQRTALGSVFYSSVDSLQKSVLTAVSDSLVNRLFYFDMQKKQGQYSSYRKKAEQEIRSNFNRGIPYRYSANDARALADFYLSKTSWDTSVFRVDTTFIKRINTINAANVRYVSEDVSFGQPLKINVVVAPTGALLQMNASYVTVPSEGPPNTWQIIHTIIIFGLALAGLVIFFFRMRSRSIDTQSALVAAVVMGVVSPAYVFLAQAVDGLPFGGDTTVNESIFLFLQMGISGAVYSVGFFVLFAVSDSLTRQHWPQKISSYDYLRQGMILNKPVGVVILRSLGLSLVLAGVWTLILAVFPDVYFSFQHLFLSGQAAWAPLFLLLKNIWVSFGIVLAVFLVIGSLAYGRSKNKWITGFFILLACGVFMPFFNSFGPVLYEFMLGMLIGVALLFIYYKWDFLTLFLSHFLFLGLLGSVSGWLVSNSPDIWVFVIFVGFVAVLAALGCIAIFVGKEEQSLPQYVPGYVEELAQEQRIKQELQIAREVQQSFLPSKTPAISGLDVAAVCQPAYETGGDYYDFIPLDDHRMAVAIGDVSGKGIQAAFYMTFVKGMLHSLCGETDSPAQVLSRANRLFYDNATKGTFVSLIYGIIDLKKQTFTFARAGHNPILHTHISSDKVDELQPHGLGIGLTKEKIFDNKIREIELSITEDDLFLLYTDGIIEALNENHQFYGTGNLIKLIKKQKHQPASKIVSVISKRVTQFIGKANQHDDMTLMAIRFGKKKD